MSDKLFALEAPKELKAITINGAVHVESEEERQKKRAERAAKRKSRWDEGSSSKQQKHSVPSMPTIININQADNKAQDIYVVQLQIREVTHKLGLPNLGIPPNPKDRSPSPEPIYNNRGVRMNTRYERTKCKLINSRNTAITKLKALDPTYQPPSCWSYKNASLEDKIDIPQDAYPQYNFMGLILGPRGNSLEKIKERTGCKIIVKGRGSLKDGMTGIKKDGSKFDALDEPMHCVINGPTPEAVKAAGDEIRNLVKMQIDDPDCERMVAMRAAHMHELAVLNGTLKDIDMKCLNCGRSGHKTWQCPESENVTASIICSACGGVGHLSKDCKARRPGEVFNQSSGGAELDDEYSAFLDDLGVRKKAAAIQDEKPYVPPMGDLSKLPSSSSALGKTVGAQRLMLTNGSAAPGAASAAARKQSASGVPIHLEGTSIFGGRLVHYNSGYSQQMGFNKKTESDKKKEEANYVPTHWVAEHHDRAAARRAEQEMAKLEHAKLLAKINKRKEEGKVIKVDGPPPPPPGSSFNNSSFPKML